MKLLEEIKSHSSKWMKTKHDSLSKFYWQDSYGAFSVDPKDVDIVSAYIDNQHVHHRRISFQDDYRALLELYKVEYDERWVWD